MPVYNGECHLKEAIESILNQTLIDFEFIIINDGSTDKTRSILENYHDPRIVLVHNPKNMGLTQSLNKGLNIAQGAYLARMDADDIALPLRLEKQVYFLENCLAVGILGSSCLLIDPNGQEIGLKQMPTSNLDIRWTSLLANPFIHPTVMIRRDILIQNGLRYDESFQTSQDYDLWVRILNNTCGANLNEPLLQYRVSSDDITSRHRESQLRNHDIIALRTIRERIPGYVITLEEVSQLRALFVGGKEYTPVSKEETIVLAHSYLDMLDCFVKYHSKKPGLETLQHRETLKVIRLGGYALDQSNWKNIGKQFINMISGLSWGFWIYVFNRIGRRLWRYLVR